MDIFWIIYVRYLYFYQVTQCKVLFYLQASYSCAFTQLVPNITYTRPPQHPVPTTCTVHNSSVSTFLTWNCSLQCHKKCAVVNLNIYITISLILKLLDAICALWNTLNLTSLCPICLPAIQVSILHVTAYVDVTQLHCLSNITFLFHNQFDVAKFSCRSQRTPR